MNQTNQVTQGGAFFWVTCQIGAESVVKHEIARVAPDFRFAFSRPGFMTFKSDTQPVAADFGSRFDWAFARAWGKTLAQGAPDSVPREAVRWAQELAARGQPMRLHVFERDEFATGDEPDTYFPGTRAREMEERILKFAHEISPVAPVFAEGPNASEAVVGEPVLDVIWVQDDKWFIGIHTHAPFRSRYPGGNSPITLPPEAPSRAYLKAAELIDWADADLKPGQVAVELGSAPGGAVWYMLERGLKVVGVDPGAMHPRVLAHPNYRHVSKTVSELDPSDLPEHVDWLLLDMNAEPRTTLALTGPILETLAPDLQGVLLTLKLNLWKFGNDVPRYLFQIRQMLPGFEVLRAAQLSNHRQEVGVIGIRGTRRVVAGAGTRIRPTS